MAKKTELVHKIQIITDTACDIPDELLGTPHLVMLPIPFVIDGKGYLERVDFTPEEFYDKLSAAKELPSTSHITTPTFQQAFQDALENGFTHVIVVTISSKGSNMFGAATIAKKLFLEENSGISMKITILDSGGYSALYGYPVLQSVAMAEKGASPDEIIDYLEDWFSHYEILLATYTLEYAKRSGRIPVAAAFVGDVLGLRPIFSLIDGQTKVLEKVRGDKNVVVRMASIAASRTIDKKAPSVMVVGSLPQHGQDLIKNVQKQFGKPPKMVMQCGAAIALNAGPKMVGLIYRGERRINTRAREQDFLPKE